MARIIQDIKVRADGQIGEILWECPIPDGATVENLVHERMEDHHASKSGVQGVRVVDEDGNELYRWTAREEADRQLNSKLEKVRRLANDELERRAKRSSDT